MAKWVGIFWFNPFLCGRTKNELV